MTARPGLLPHIRAAKVRDAVVLAAASVETVDDVVIYQKTARNEWAAYRYPFEQQGERVTDTALLRLCKTVPETVFMGWSEAADRPTVFAWVKDTLDKTLALTPDELLRHPA